MVTSDGTRRTKTLSRRQALKVTGCSLGAFTVAGAGITAASTTDTRWRVGLSFPTLAMDDNGQDRLFNVDNADGTVEGYEGYEYDGMFVLPNGTQNTNCSFWNGCDYYRAKLPYILEWGCETSNFGEVEIIINTTPFSGVGYGAVHQFNSQHDSVAIESGAPGSDLLQPKFTKESVPAQNYFRPFDVELTVNLSNSSLGDGEVSTTIPAAIPSVDILNDLENLVNTTDEIYSQGVDLADKTTPVDLNRLDKLGRYYAYTASAAVGLDDDLPRAAAKDGIGAFTEPIKDYQERQIYGENTVSTMGGPTIFNTP
ncbi:hypothetical protein [Natrinema marinum]|uniref:hypothetical protein n=1 Tax=Natrinema marinum TaxID=2961598 RepID=UPI0020C90F37|nr:hypothetical protein [Natrinema marinum]